MAVQKKQRSLTAAEKREFAGLASDLLSRQIIGERLGKSYNGDRDIYDTLGYKKSLDYKDFTSRYSRQDIAKAIIRRPTNACWRGFFEVNESQDKETAFEKTWKDLAKKHRLSDRFSRVDRLASLGRYAVLVLGFSDTIDLTQPVTRAERLLYVHAYSEDAAKIMTEETDPTNERFGLPKTYQIKAGRKQTDTIIVHHTRVIHVAHDCLENDVEGTPVLEAVWNRLQDVELLAGGSAEMFWRGALPGYAFKLDDGADFPLEGSEAEVKLETEITDYMHRLKRYLRLKNISVENLATQVADPKGHFDVQVDLIAAGTGIPKRILMGSELGDLASTQDASNWAKVIDERREQFCEPIIVRPVIDQLISVGVLPAPTEEYSVKWADLLTPSAKEKADVGLVVAGAVAAYANSLDASQYVAPEVMLKKIGFTDEEIAQNEEILQKADREERDDPEPDPNDNPQLNNPEDKDDPENQK